MSVFIYEELIPKIEKYFDFKIENSVEEIGYGERALVFEDVTNLYPSLEEWQEHGAEMTCYEDSNGELHYAISIKDKLRPEGAAYDLTFCKEDVEY